jgi:hypothetical protein
MLGLKTTSTSEFLRLEQLEEIVISIIKTRYPNFPLEEVDPKVEKITACIRKAYPQHLFDNSNDKIRNCLQTIIKRKGLNEIGEANFDDLKNYTKLEILEIDVEFLLQKMHQHITTVLSNHCKFGSTEKRQKISVKLCIILYTKVLNKFLKENVRYKIESILDEELQNIIPKEFIEFFISDSFSYEETTYFKSDEFVKLKDEKTTNNILIIFADYFKLDWLFEVKELSINTSSQSKEEQQEGKGERQQNNEESSEKTKKKNVLNNWLRLKARELQENSQFKKLTLKLIEISFESKINFLLFDEVSISSNNGSSKKKPLIFGHSSDEVKQEFNLPPEVQELPTTLSDSSNPPPNNEEIQFEDSSPKQTLQPFEFNPGYQPNLENQRILKPSSVKAMLEQMLSYSGDGFFAFIFTVITNFSKLRGFLESHSKVIFPIAPLLDLIDFLFKGIDFIISRNKNIQKGGEAAFSFFKFAATTTVVAGAIFAFMSPFLVHILFTGIVATGFVWSVGSFIFHTASSALTKDENLKQYHRANAKKAAIAVGLSSISAIALAGVFFIQTVVPIVPLLLGLAAVVAIAIGSGIKIYYQLKAKNTSKQKIELKKLNEKNLSQDQKIIDDNFQKNINEKIKSIKNDTTLSTEYKNNNFFSDSTLYGTLEAKVNAVKRNRIDYQTLITMIRSKCKALQERMTKNSVDSSPTTESKSCFFPAKSIEQQKIEGLAALLVYLQDPTEAKTYSVVKFEHFVKELSTFNPKLFSATSKAMGEVEALFSLAKLYISSKEEQAQLQLQAPEHVIVDNPHANNSLTSSSS